jgi:hypothetical protein
LGRDGRPRGLADAEARRCGAARAAKDWPVLTPTHGQSLTTAGADPSQRLAGTDADPGQRPAGTRTPPAASWHRRGPGQRLAGNDADLTLRRAGADADLTLR